jgi:hypothetical protein
LVSGSEQITYSGLTGIPSGIVSGSAQIADFGIFATTGSNGFNGNQSITGSLTVTGQVVAQTLNVQQVTSSVVYSSGSNVFGNDLGNTQQFTGSMLVTGSLAVAGAGWGIAGSGTAGNAISFTQAMTLDTSGRLGIGTTSPQGLLQIGANALSNNTDASNAFNLKQTSTTAATGIYLERSGERRGYYMYIGGSVDSLTFARNDAGTKADVMSLTRDGNVGIGTTSPGANLHVVRANDGGSGTPGVILSTANGANDIVRFQDGTTTTAVVKNDGSIFAGSSTGVTLNSLTNRLSVSSTTYNLFDISRFSDNAFGPNFYLVKSRNGSIGGNTIVANDDNLGNINWVGANGTGFTDAASIKAEVDGTPGASNDMPGRLVFSTTADGSGSSTERMRITSGGNVGIGVTDPNTKLHISGPLTFTEPGFSTVRRHSISNSHSDGSSPNNYLAFNISDGGGTTSERMRINGEGNLGIGTTEPDGRLHVKDNGYRKGIILERGGSTADRGFLYIGDGTTSTTADEIYFDGNNTDFHFRTGAGGTDERLRITVGGNSQFFGSLTVDQGITVSSNAFGNYFGKFGAASTTLLELREFTGDQTSTTLILRSSRSDTFYNQIPPRTTNPHRIP